MRKQALVGLGLLLMTAALSAEEAPSAKLVAFTHAALKRAPISRRDRTPERTAKRAENDDVFAREIARVAEKAPLPARQWISLIVAQGSVETNFDTEVVAGRCLAFQCDPKTINGVRVPQSVGAFQQQRVAHVRDIWSLTPTIPQQVEMVDRSLRRSLGRCKAFAAFPAHVFRAYGGGSCSWEAPREAERVAAYVRSLSTVQKKEGGAS